jgi:hypothetical protein
MTKAGERIDREQVRDQARQISGHIVAPNKFLDPRRLDTWHEPLVWQASGHELEHGHAERVKVTRRRRWLKQALRREISKCTRDV